MSAGRRLLAVADALPVTVLAVIAGAGSFTHIRDTAAEHGQRGLMSWSVAASIDLTCVMAARERQRDKQLGTPARRLSWPTAVLAGGVLLSLAANLAQAQPTDWGRIVAAVPPAAFLVAVSMIERRAARRPRRIAGQDGAAGGPSAPGRPSPVPGAGDEAQDGRDEALLTAARRAVSERAAELAGFVPRVGFQTSSHDRLLALVSEGLGVAFVPASAVGDPPPHAVVVRPASPAVERTVGVAWRAGRRQTPAASAFLGLLYKHAGQASSR